MKKRWIAAGLTAVVLTGGLVAARSRGKTAPKEEPSPFRLGKVQAEDLQVSVREVGVVDPETKVDVKSAVSGRVVSLKVRDGAVVKTGDVLAEVEPDVTQAQSRWASSSRRRESRTPGPGMMSMARNRQIPPPRTGEVLQVAAGQSRRSCGACLGYR